MTHKFKVGDKVVPINKTISGPLSMSIVWRRANNDGQKYLYVNTVADTYYVCLDTQNANRSGDFFAESDLIPYIDLADKIKSICDRIDILYRRYNTSDDTIPRLIRSEFGRKLGMGDTFSDRLFTSEILDYIKKSITEQNRLLNTDEYDFLKLVERHIKKSNV